ncbi:O-acetyltransferase PC-16-like protein [Cladobotryum mycophilum]|uniref:O-acetyltransferase PC-16-like protein n=1 Tax=Cladobotryum mycophilum TaxID=491253 RepID=A0ABR0S855_9HYPO
MNPESKLSPIDWLMPRSYISQILCFESTSLRIPEALKDGLAGLVKDVPYLLCGVIDADAPQGSVGLSEPYQTLDDLFSQRNLSAEVDYTELKSNNFPPLAFNELNIFPEDLASEDGHSQPVFRAVLSLVRGGFLLHVSVHHSTTDIVGFGALLKIWASHCNTGSSTPLGFSISWLDRDAICKAPAKHASIDMPLLLNATKQTGDLQSQNSMDSSEMETSIFRFFAGSLQGLKTEVTKQLPVEIPWVSTGDILTALLWSAIVFAESEREIDFLAVTEPPQGTKLCQIRIPVNFRNRYAPPLPHEYLGAAFCVTLATAEEADLLSISARNRETLVPALARVAAAIREAINRVNKDEVDGMIEYLASQKDLKGIKLGPANAGMSMVSWADEGIHDLYWGSDIGRCEAVRLPKLKSRRYPIVLPRLPTGDLEVLISHQEKIMNRLKGVLSMG